MTDSPNTRASLLLRLRDPRDQQAWEEFLAIYEPVVYRLAVRRGLQHADALDLCQDTLVRISAAIGDFDPSPEKGRFRGWLHKIASNLISTAITRRCKLPVSAGGDEAGPLAAIANPSSADATEFALEYRRQIFGHAAQAVKAEVSPETWQAFWKTCVEGEPIPKVAEQLGLSLGSVYAARSRVMARLRKAVELWDTTVDLDVEGGT